VAKGEGTYRSVAEILAGKNLADPQQRAFAVAEMKEAETIRYEAVVAKAKELGIPVRIEGPGNKVSILHDIKPEGPVYRTTMNLNAAISSAANLVGPAPYNLNGSGIKVGVWDAGSVRRTHREFATNRVTNRNASVANDDHATHVAGTIGALGVTASARGMATNVLVDSYDWNSDYAEMTSAGAATLNDIAKVPVSNHSYGYNATTADMGRYNAESRQTDIVTYSLPYYLPFWAAGNEQDSLTAKGGYQSITYNGLSKNLMTVGAVNDAVTSGARDITKATMSSFSSWGPTDDGRIKPDLVANGVSVNSSISTGDAAYDSYSGTSMATPSASGSSALLIQLYAREFGNKLMRASTLKGLLIHTADDLGTAGPDYKFGWGLMNTKAAADVIRDHKASPGAPKLIEDTITTSATNRTHTFNWDGTSPIRATLAWTDPAGTARNDNDRNPVLVHNLDLRVTAPNGTVFLPYVMPFSTNFTDANFGAAAIKGTNRVDNVERVDIPAPPVAGTYTVSVSLAGSLTTNSQVYSLIVTGSIGSAIPPQLAAIDPITIVNGRPLTIPVTATDPADNDPITLTAANLPGNSTFQANGSTGTFNWAAAAPNGTYTPRFTATDKDGSTTQTVTINVVSNTPPTLAPIGDKNVIVSNALTFAVTATDPIGNDPITLTAANLPPGATFNATGGNGTFTWSNASPVGVYPVTFTATDMAGSVSETIYITVKPTPVFVSGTNTNRITIPDSGKATPYPSSINISGATGIVERVIVKLNNFAHLYPADLDIVLVGPQGQKSVVMGTAGGASGVVGLNLVFDDSAESEAPTPLESGTWKPTGSIPEALPAPAPGLPYETSFTSFVGTSPNGTWTLYINDFEAPDNGNINGGWSLEIEVVTPTNRPPAISVTDPAPIPVGSDFELDVTANDLTDNDVITLSADQLPPGATFATVTNASTVTGKMTWNNAGPVGAYTATFRATDENGTTTRTVPLSVFVPPPPPPAAIWFSATNNSSLTATWNTSSQAASYRLDVSANPAFETVSDVGTPTPIFSHAGPPGSGTGGTWTEQNVGGTTYLIMTNSASRLISPTALFSAGVADSLTFQARTFGGISAANNVITVSVSTNVGATWTVLGTRTPLSTTLSPMTPFDLSAYDGKQIAVKFETLGASGTRGAGIRSVAVRSLVYEVVPDYLPGYANRSVNTTSEVITGLQPAKTYYARVRAVGEGGTSANSPVASGTTTFSPEPPSFTSSAGPFTNQTGTVFTLPVTASGLPAPTISLESSTASGGYTFSSNTLTYMPSFADLGTRTFNLVASNGSGTAMQTVTVMVTAGPPSPPASIRASATNNTSFVASWSAVDGATSYRLDVATNASFVGAPSPATDLFISEYIEGSGNNKAIEIFNGTSAAVNLGTGGYALRLYANGSTNPTTIALSNTVAAGDVHVVANSSANATILGRADQTSGSLNHNGNDVIALAKAGTNIDVIGTISSSNNFAVDVTKVRNSTVSAGVTTYNPAQWTDYPVDTLNYLGSHTFSGGIGQPAFVPGYENLTVFGTSQLVSGLTPNSIYYFRARAVNDAGVSLNSPIASVTTTVFPSDPQLDSDLDGLPDSVEQFMGLNPMVSDNDGAMNFGRVGGQMFMDYRKSKTPGAWQGAVKWKIDLESINPWSSLNVIDSFLSDHGAYEMRRATVPLQEGETKKFMRLEVWPE
jgi:subtilisin-like proprotein convertase family protein